MNPCLWCHIQCSIIHLSKCKYYELVFCSCHNIIPHHHTSLINPIHTHPMCRYLSSIDLMYLSIKTFFVWHLSAPLLPEMTTGASLHFHRPSFFYLPPWLNRLYSSSRPIQTSWNLLLLTSTPLSWGQRNHAITCSAHSCNNASWRCVWTQALGHRKHLPFS